MKSARQFPLLDRVVQAFADALRENPDFAPPLQSGRVRCDVCGAYHPGATCARCCALLQEARALAEARTREQAEQERREARRDKHAARRAAPGYTRARQRNRSRRALRRDIDHGRAWMRARFSTFGLLLFSSVWILLFWCGVAMPEARRGLQVAALFYGALLFLLIATQPHARLRTRFAAYGRWHGQGRTGTSSTLWHVFALALWAGGTGAALSSAQRAIPTSSMRAEQPLVTLWTTTRDWNAWTGAGVDASFERDTLSLHARKKAHITAISQFGQFDWSPRNIAIAPDERYAYVTGTEQYPAIVARLQTKLGNRGRSRTVDIQGRARGLAVTPDGSSVLVANETSNAITRIPVREFGPGHFTTFPVGRAPSSVAIAPDGSTALVSNRDDSTISRVSMQTERITATVPLGQRARSIAFGPRGDFALIANVGAGRLLRLNLRDNTISATLTNAAGPCDVAIAPKGDFALVALRNAPELLRVRTHDLSVVARISLPGPVGDVAVAPDGSYALASSASETAVYCVRLTNNSLALSLRTRGMPHEIAIAPSGRFALLCNGYDVARIEGGVPEYATRGIAQNALDLQTLPLASTTPPRPATSPRPTTLHLSKRDGANHGALVYYGALNGSPTSSPLPAISNADDLAAWQSHGWTRLLWNKSETEIAVSPTARYLHLAVFMQRSAFGQSPHLRALSVSRAP